MTFRSTSHIEVKRLAIKSNSAIQETRHHLDANIAHLLHKITSLPLQNLPEPSPSVIEQKIRPHLQTAALPAKLAKRLQTVLMPVLISVRSFTSMNMMDFTLSIRRGRVIVERWTTSGEVVYEVLKPGTKLRHRNINADNMDSSHSHIPSRVLDNKAYGAMVFIHINPDQTSQNRANKRGNCRGSKNREYGSRN